MATCQQCGRRTEAYRKETVTYDHYSGVRTETVIYCPECYDG